ncbi:MAG TPA: hypothetical protein VGE24_08210, partial [Emticicia sp.]
MNKYSYYFRYLTFLVSLLFCTCKHIPDNVQSVISESDNSAQLKKAINHYQETGEKNKLKALYYLIDNMRYKYHVEGKGVENYNYLLDKLCETPEIRKEFYSSIWDSLANAHSIRFPGETYTVYDINTITAELLIEHIDAAFKAWQMPWAKELSFEDFCEYILPYKLVNEVPDSWMQQIQKSFKDIPIPTEDPYEACLLINSELKKRFKIRSIPVYWDLNYTKLDKIRSGKCYQATQYSAYVMRAMGVPVVMDFTPLWGNMNGGHEWNALIWNGKPVPFVGSESDPGKTKVDLAMQRKRSKVFRHTYTIQKDGLQYLTQGTEEIPQLFKDYYLKDVTREYIPVSDVEVMLNKNNVNFNYVFLCVFNRQKWQPIYWAKNNQGQAKFKDMGRKIAYLPVYYSGGELLPASEPFLL